MEAGCGSVERDAFVLEVLLETDVEWATGVGLELGSSSGVELESSSGDEEGLSMAELFCGGGL